MALTAAFFHKHQVKLNFRNRPIICKFFENMLSLFSLSIQKKNFATENFEISTQKNTQNGQQQNDPI